MIYLQKLKKRKSNMELDCLPSIFQLYGIKLRPLSIVIIDLGVGLVIIVARKIVAL